MLLFFISLVSITGLTVAAKLPPTLVLKCNEYPGVCDTHCYAAACTVGQSPSATDVTRYLHYSKDADQNEVGGGHTSDEASSRRTAIGCASSGCAGKSGATPLQCDEFPYASTYEGGLGCHIRRYKAAQTPPKWGVWHCTDASDNGKHGNHLKQFYTNMQNNDPYQVAFDEANVDQAPLCRAIRQLGMSACSATRNPHWTTKISTTAYCPRERGDRRRDDQTEDEHAQFDPLLRNATTPSWDIYVNRTAHTVSDAHGGRLWYPFGGPPPSGTHVYRMRDDGSLHQSHVV